MHIMVLEKVEVENSPIFEDSRGTVVCWCPMAETDALEPPQ